MTTSNEAINLENESTDHNLNSIDISADINSRADTLHQLNIRPRTKSGHKPAQSNSSQQQIKILKPPNPGKRVRGHLSKQGSEYIHQSRHHHAHIEQPFITLEKTLHDLTTKMVKLKMEDDDDVQMDGVRTPVSIGTRGCSNDSPGKLAENSSSGRKLSNMARFCNFVLI